MARVLICALLVLLAGCTGGTGRWENDPNNWGRAFGDSTLPEGVTVVHSVYWRSKSLPREDGWIFELKLSPERRKVLFENLKLREPKPDEDHIVKLLKTAQPSWFLPKPAARYRITIGKGGEKSGVYTGSFEDTESGTIFLVGVGL